mgnify:FL=1
MPKIAYHPKARLAKVRNVKAGLISRTKIISSVEDGARTVAEISKRSALSYGCVSHHLRLLRKEKITVRSGSKRRYAWALTEFGQQKLQS